MGLNHHTTPHHQDKLGSWNLTQTLTSHFSKAMEQNSISTPPPHLNLSLGGNWKLKRLNLKSFQAEHFLLESCLIFDIVNKCRLVILENCYWDLLFETCYLTLDMEATSFMDCCFCARALSEFGKKHKESFYCIKFWDFYRSRPQLNNPHFKGRIINRLSLSWDNLFVREICLSGFQRFFCFLHNTQIFIAQLGPNLNNKMAVIGLACRLQASQGCPYRFWHGGPCPLPPQLYMKHTSPSGLFLTFRWQ